MPLLLRLFQHINVLSIDVVSGAIASALFFGRIFNVNIRPIGLVALGLTVWVIYTVDHLRDAKKIAHPAATLRHRFHQENFRILLFLLFTAIIADAVAIFFIRRQVFEWGLVLTAGVGLYLLFHRSLPFLKELFVASLYTAGILLPSITVSPVHAGGPHYVLIFQFAIAAWTNLLLFSWFDQVFDQRNEQKSFVTILGKETTQTFLLSLFALSFLLTIIQLLMEIPIMPVLILLLMNATLFLIFVFREALEKDDRYRLIGDAVFLFPFLLLVA